MFEKRPSEGNSFSLLDIAPEAYGPARTSPVSDPGPSLNQAKVEKGAGLLAPAADPVGSFGQPSQEDRPDETNAPQIPPARPAVVHPAPPGLGKAPGKPKKKEAPVELDYDALALDSRFHRLIQQLEVKPSLEQPLIIGVTSTLRGEGRTTVAMGLASAISQTLPQPVALLEADLGNPTLAHDFNLPAYGLSEFLRGEIDLEELTRATKLPDLAIIVAGKSEGHNTLDLLRSERLTKLLGILNRHFAAVIVDLPPMCLIGEATRVISQVDKVVMVVESGSTPTKLVKSALELIPDEKLLGVLLNRTRPAFGLARLFERIFG